MWNRSQLTVPYTPQQNGVAERANRTLTEMARCMMVCADVDDGLWAEAIANAAYLSNRSPSKPIDGKRPNEVWHQRKPSVQHLRIFGVQVFALDKTQHNNFRSKGAEYVFIGYSKTAKAYRLFHKETKQVIERRDIKFLEDDVKKCDTSSSSSQLFFDNVADSKPLINIFTTVASKEAQTETEYDSVNGYESTELMSEENQPDLVEGVHEDVDVTAANEEPHRARGRPQIIRTGAPGRPRKVYQTLNFSAEVGDTDLPQTVEEALGGIHKNEWQESMQNEFDALVENDTWSLVDLPANQKAIGPRWMFQIKKDANGNIKKYKSRLVAKGCNQIFGVNYADTFSPVIRYDKIRLLFAIAVEKKLYMHQMDVSNAYLNAHLKDEIYLKQPEGFESEDFPNRVLKLKRAIYGLKQSGRVWNDTLDTTLINFGFKPCESETCLYVNENNEHYCLAAVYVDDIILACSNNQFIINIESKIAEIFKTHDCGPIKQFLGMEIRRDGDLGSIYVTHRQYIKNMLNYYGMGDCREAATPLDPGFTAFCNNSDCTKVDVKAYQSQIGSLMYLAITTRPDILHAVTMLARRNVDPHVEHEAGVRHLYRYLAKTKDYNLCFRST